MLKELFRKGPIVTYLVNAILKLKHRPKEFKQAEIIIISKPVKPHTKHLPTYRLLSLLSIISKLVEIILIQLINIREFMSQRQLGFRRYHSTIQQCHRLLNDK